jgi:hypothetical protein
MLLLLKIQSQRLISQSLEEKEIDRERGGEGSFVSTSPFFSFFFCTP